MAPLSTIERQVEDPAHAHFRSDIATFTTPQKRRLGPSPVASLLDSQHGCITSPHAKKESGQTPYAVWSPLVQEFLGQGSGFDCCGVWFLFIFADSATTFADSARPN